MIRIQFDGFEMTTSGGTRGGGGGGARRDREGLIGREQHL